MAVRKVEIIIEVCELLGMKLGVEFANCYEEFYADKSIKTIVMSAEELLTEGFGKEEAARLMAPIKRKLKK